jgi:hypothetical protein
LESRVFVIECNSEKESEKAPHTELIEKKETYLGNTVRRTRVERRGLLLRSLSDLSIQLRGGSLNPCMKE